MDIKFALISYYKAKVREEIRKVKQEMYLIMRIVFTLRNTRRLI